MAGSPAWPQSRCPPSAPNQSVEQPGTREAITADTSATGQLRAGVRVGFHRTDHARRQTWHGGWTPSLYIRGPLHSGRASRPTPRPSITGELRPSVRPVVASEAPCPANVTWHGGWTLFPLVREPLVSCRAGTAIHPPCQVKFEGQGLYRPPLARRPRASSGPVSDRRGPRKPLSTLPAKSASTLHANSLSTVLAKSSSQNRGFRDHRWPVDHGEAPADCPTSGGPKAPVLGT